MGFQSTQIVKAQENAIRKLMYDDLKSDREIMKELNIITSTFYEYKRRIHDEDAHIWDKIHVDSTKFRATELLSDLDYCRTECLKMAKDKNIGYRDRMEALKTSCEASANIFKLLNEGLSFQVSIPIQHHKAESTPEDKPKEDKDIPNTTDKALIPSGGEPWGTSLQRPNRSTKPIEHKLGQISKVRRKKMEIVEEDNTLQLD